MNLGVAGAYARYSFAREWDLAVIYLGNEEIGDELVALGYKAISIEDIMDEPSSEGSEVFTVGFPDRVAILGQIPEIARDPEKLLWASENYSLPVFSFGKIAMLAEGLPFFWVDLNAWPGNSGGPIVEGKKLVGIVYEQAMVGLDQIPELSVRIPVTKAMKTRYVRQLVKILEERVAAHEKMFPIPQREAPGHN